MRVCLGATVKVHVGDQLGMDKNLETTSLNMQG